MLLSAALIVKNEEVHLERCLKSLCKLLPQIVILDTGSSDKTVDIAKKYTNLIYYQKWQNDFALHRNKSFSYCTADWIIQIDADEELCFLPEFTPETLLEFLEKLPKTINAVGLPMKDWRESQKEYVAELDLVRIFRKNQVTWKRRIHNEAMYNGETAYFPLAYIKHYGYDLTEDQKKAKAKRTITLLLKSIEEDPADFDSLFYLAQAYAAWLDDGEKAIEYSQKYLACKPIAGSKFNASIFHLAINIFMKQKNFDEAMRWINIGLEHNIDNIDVCYDLMQLGLKQNKPELVASGAQRFVVAIEKFQDNRLKHSGQFFFTNKAICYCLALHYLSVALYEQATIVNAKLKHVLPKLSKERQTELMSKQKEILDKLGWEIIDDRRIITPDDIRRDKIMRPNERTPAKPIVVATTI